jgi:threonine synthase
MSVGIMARYGEYLPIDENTPRFSLGEGGTPLVAAKNVNDLGLRSLHFKVDGQNPTGSFKDRGMVIAVARAAQRGAHTVVCASTGNTSASASAYAARYGLRCVVVIPKGRVAHGKLLQAHLYGAKLLTIDGNFDAAMKSVRTLGDRDDICVVNSINPDRIAGQTTAAFEIVDELGDAPDILAVPVGNAGNITAYWRGFQRYASEGKCRTTPRMVGGQAAGAAPLVLGAPVTNPETFATAIRIGNPASWKFAIDARDASEGLIDSVTDEEIATAQRDLAAQEGIFCEPASASSLAVLRKAVGDGRIDKTSRAVCVLTGNGLKDPAAVADVMSEPVTCDGSVESILEAIGTS